MEHLPNSESEEKAFVPVSVDELREWLRGKKQAAAISIDLSSITEPNTFKAAARLVKGFIELNPITGRSVSVRATQAQRSLEVNVFESGITFVEAE